VIRASASAFPAVSICDSADDNNPRVTAPRIVERPKYKTARHIGGLVGRVGFEPT
jgi:hypothetical protein